MKEKIENFSKIFINVTTKIVIFAVICFVLYNIGRSILKNYQTMQKIDSIKSDISAQEEENLNLQNLILYYQTDTYKELEARRKLGYKKPGENVLIIPDLNPANKNLDAIPPEKIPEPEKEEPNFIKWYHYIFHR